MLDSCHALRDFGVNRYTHPDPLSADEERARTVEREAYAWKMHDEIWRTLPARDKAAQRQAPTVFPIEPQENLLYFIEKYSPRLAPWQREIVRIVRKIAQYFYPQGQTKLMNEGWATFWHYTILNRLYEKGLVDDGFMIEFLQSHTNVVSQSGFDRKGYSGLNPYALGFAMFTDIRRICEKPTAEDRAWFPDIAGKDWRQVLDSAMRNYKDESFIGQFLSPRVIREFHLFAVADHAEEPTLEIAAIHNENGYRRVRKLLAQQTTRPPPPRISPAAPRPHLGPPPSQLPRGFGESRSPNLWGFWGFGNGRENRGGGLHGGAFGPLAQRREARDDVLHLDVVGRRVGGGAQALPWPGQSHPAARLRRRFFPCRNGSRLHSARIRRGSVSGCSGRAGSWIRRKEGIGIDGRALPPAFLGPEHEDRKMQVRGRRARVARAAHVADHVAALDLASLGEALCVLVQVGVVVGEFFARIELVDREAAGLAREQLGDPAVLNRNHRRAPAP